MNPPRVGQRVRLVECRDAYAHLRPGLQGVVVLVDALGTLHVRWDDVSCLGLVPGVDRWCVVE